MYTNNFIPLTPEEIKKVNATELATKYKVSNSYVSRTLKSHESPKSDVAINILADARKIIELYDGDQTKKTA